MVRGNNTRPPSDSSSGGSAPMEDSSSPYFLQGGDHPGLILVATPLSGSNYNSWNRAMLLALTAKNKLIFVDGSLSRLPPSDLLFNSWNRCNSMVISWILNSVSKEISESLLYFPNAYEVWTDLKTRYSQANGPRIFQLKQQISSLCQGSLDVNSYYGKLKVFWDELQEYLPLPLCACGALREMNNRRDQDHVIQFLIGLNDSYSAARAQILLIDPLPSLAKVFSMILQEERQRQISVSLPASAVPDTPFLGSVTTADDSPVTMAVTTQRRQRPICTYCHLSGHTRDKCFKLHGFPPGYKPRNPKPSPGPHPPQAHFVHSVTTHPKSHPKPNASCNPNPSAAADVPLAFTPTQYNQLLSLIQ